MAAAARFGRPGHVRHVECVVPPTITLPQVYDWIKQQRHQSQRHSPASQTGVGSTRPPHLPTHDLYERQRSRIIHEVVRQWRNVVRPGRNREFLPSAEDAAGRWKCDMAVVAVSARAQGRARRSEGFFPTVFFFSLLFFHSSPFPLLLLSSMSPDHNFFDAAPCCIRQAFSTSSVTATWREFSGISGRRSFVAVKHSRPLPGPPAPQISKPQTKRSWRKQLLPSASCEVAGALRPVPSRSLTGKSVPSSWRRSGVPRKRRTTTDWTPQPRIRPLWTTVSPRL